MNVKMSTARIVAVCAACACALYTACSVSPVAGGGTDMPNGNVVSGRVLLPDSTSYTGCDVALVHIVMTDSGDSISLSWTDITASDGAFVFQDVSAGKHTLFVSDEANGWAALRQIIDVEADTGLDIRLGDIVLAAMVNLAGHIILPTGFADPADITVSVPGTGRAVSPGPDGAFLLENLPQGEYDIAFLLDSIANFSHLRIVAGDRPDIQLHDFEFAIINAMASSEYRPCDSRADFSYYVPPKQYRRGSEPPWYDNVDTLRVKYFDRDSLREEFEEWVKDTSEYPHHDMMIFGWLFRTGNSTFVVTPQQDSLTVSGPLVDGLPGLGETVVAMVKEQRNNQTGEKEYEVIKIEVVGLQANDRFCDFL